MPMSNFLINVDFSIRPSLSWHLLVPSKPMPPFILMSSIDFNSIIVFGLYKKNAIDLKLSVFLSS